MIKSYKPTSKSRRHMSVVSYKSILTKNKPIKALTFGFKRPVGRNNTGRITVRHKVGDIRGCLETLILNTIK